MILVCDNITHLCKLSLATWAQDTLGGGVDFLVHRYDSAISITNRHCNTPFYLNHAFFFRHIAVTFYRTNSQTTNGLETT